MPELKRFSIAVIENDEQQLLLLKRAPNREFAPSLWGFPAGHIEIDETPLQCIYREMDEEIGKDHQLEFLSEFGPVRDQKFGGQMEVNLYHFRWLSGQVVLNSEHTQFCWRRANDTDSLPLAPGVLEDLHYLNIRPQLEQQGRMHES